jgi:predicted ribosome quality control (RQC) complex YloA/Tae2 family protein
MNTAAERYYRILVEHQQYETLKTSLLRPLSGRLAKLQKKQEHLIAQKTQIEQAAAYKQKGELITANLYQLSKGMNTAEIVDYYHENQMIEIPLDPKLTPSQNAQRYFKRYRKLKQGKDVTEQRLLKTDQEITYLEEVLFFIENADTLQELEALREEIPFKSREKAKQRPEQPRKPFLRSVSSDGFEIYIGRNSRENDLLTQRTALPEDIWLHAHRAPGSHVLILNRQRNTSVPEQTLLEAASLAAYHSKLRRSGKVDVLYTPKKYVQKPKGSPPGLVRVSQFEILRVTPQAKV